jgi:hypothetical protein
MDLMDLTHISNQPPAIAPTPMHAPPSALRPNLFSGD